MRRHGLAALLCCLLVAVLLALTSHPLAAQSSDTTGLLGPVLDHFWPVIVTFLVSLTVKGISIANQGFARTSEPVKWAALYGFALAYNYLAGWLHIATLDPLAPVFALSAVQTGAAALIFKFGGHTVPTS